MNFIIKLILSAIAVIVTSYFLKGVTLSNSSFYTTSSPEINKFITALMVAIVLAFLNTIVKPILTILSLPITVLTLGLFLLAINAFIILFADKLVDGFKVNGFFTALIFSIILSIVTGVLNLFNKEED